MGNPKGNKYKPLPRIRGAIVKAEMPSQTPPGAEIEGSRPVLILSRTRSEHYKYNDSMIPMCFVLPISSEKGAKWPEKHPDLYVSMPKGTGALASGEAKDFPQLDGLEEDSFLLVDNAKTIGENRITELIGLIDPLTEKGQSQLKVIYVKLRAILGIQ